jgi:short-subunit dehydrogenase
VTADLADPAGIDTLVAAIAGRPVDLLVNNAGVATYGAHADLDPRVEAGVIAVNCTALVALTWAVLPGMLERRHGFVLNTASTIAFQPAPGQATYGASKAFVLSYSEALAEELRGTGVRVAAICPGATVPSSDRTLNPYTVAGRVFGGLVRLRAGCVRVARVSGGG